LILLRPRQQNREIPLTNITSWSSVELRTHAGTGVSVRRRGSAILARVNKARIEHLTLTARISAQTRADVAVAVDSARSRVLARVVLTRVNVGLTVASRVV